MYLIIKFKYFGSKMINQTAKDGKSLLEQRQTATQHVSSMEDFTTSLGGLTLRSRPTKNKTTSKKMKSSSRQDNSIEEPRTAFTLASLPAASHPQSQSKTVTSTLNSRGNPISRLPENLQRHQKKDTSKLKVDANKIYEQATMQAKQKASRQQEGGAGKSVTFGGQRGKLSLPMPSSNNINNGGGVQTSAGGINQNSTAYESSLNSVLDILSRGKQAPKQKPSQFPKFRQSSHSQAMNNSVQTKGAGFSGLSYKTNLPALPNAGAASRMQNFQTTESQRVNSYQTIQIQKLSQQPAHTSSEFSDRFALLQKPFRKGADLRAHSIGDQQEKFGDFSQRIVSQQNHSILPSSLKNQKFVTNSFGLGSVQDPADSLIQKYIRQQPTQNVGNELSRTHMSPFGQQNMTANRYSKGKFATRNQNGSISPRISRHLSPLDRQSSNDNMMFFGSQNKGKFVQNGPKRNQGNNSRNELDSIIKQMNEYSTSITSILKGGSSGNTKITGVGSNYNAGSLSREQNLSARREPTGMLLQKHANPSDLNALNSTGQTTALSRPNEEVESKQLDTYRQYLMPKMTHKMAIEQLKLVSGVEFYGDLPSLNIDDYMYDQDADREEIEEITEKYERCRRPKRAKIALEDHIMRQGRHPTRTASFATNSNYIYQLYNELQEELGWIFTQSTKNQTMYHICWLQKESDLSMQNERQQTQPPQIVSNHYKGAKNALKELYAYEMGHGYWVNPSFQHFDNYLKDKSGDPLYLRQSCLITSLFPAKAYCLQHRLYETSAGDLISQSEVQQMYPRKQFAKFEVDYTIQKIVECLQRAITSDFMSFQFIELRFLIHKDTMKPHLALLDPQVSLDVKLPEQIMKALFFKIDHLTRRFFGLHPNTTVRHKELFSNFWRKVVDQEDLATNLMCQESMQSFLAGKNPIQASENYLDEFYAGMRSHSSLFQQIQAIPEEVVVLSEYSDESEKTTQKRQMALLRRADLEEQQKFYMRYVRQYFPNETSDLTHPAFIEAQKRRIMLISRIQRVSRGLPKPNAFRDHIQRRIDAKKVIKKFVREILEPKIVAKRKKSSKSKDKKKKDLKKEPKKDAKKDKKKSKSKKDKKGGDDSDDSKDEKDNDKSARKHHKDKKDKEKDPDKSQKVKEKEKQTDKKDKLKEKEKKSKKRKEESESPRRDKSNKKKRESEKIIIESELTSPRIVEPKKSSRKVGKPVDARADKKTESTLEKLNLDCLQIVVEKVEPPELPSQNFESPGRSLPEQFQQTPTLFVEQKQPDQSESPNGIFRTSGSPQRQTFGQSLAQSSQNVESPQQQQQIQPEINSPHGQQIQETFAQNDPEQPSRNMVAKIYSSNQNHSLLLDKSIEQRDGENNNEAIMDPFASISSQPRQIVAQVHNESGINQQNDVENREGQVNVGYASEEGLQDKNIVSSSTTEKNKENEVRVFEQSFESLQRSIRSSQGRESQQRQPEFVLQSHSNGQYIPPNTANKASNSIRIPENDTNLLIKVTQKQNVEYNQPQTLSNYNRANEGDISELVEQQTNHDKYKEPSTFDRPQIMKNQNSSNYVLPNQAKRVNFNRTTEFKDQNVVNQNVQQNLAETSSFFDQSVKATAERALKCNPNRNSRYQERQLGRKLSHSEMDRYEMHMRRMKQVQESIKNERQQKNDDLVTHSLHLVHTLETFDKIRKKAAFRESYEKSLKQNVQKANGLGQFTGFFQSEQDSENVVYDGVSRSRSLEMTQFQNNKSLEALQAHKSPPEMLINNSQSHLQMVMPVQRDSQNSGQIVLRDWVENQRKSQETFNPKEDGVQAIYRSHDSVEIQNVTSAQVQHLNEDEKHSVSKKEKSKQNQNYKLEVRATNVISPEPQIKIVNSSFVQSDVHGSLNRSCENSDEKSDKLPKIVPLNQDLGPASENVLLQEFLVESPERVSNKGSKIKSEMGPIPEHHKQDAKMQIVHKMQDEPIELNESGVNGNRRNRINWKTGGVTNANSTSFSKDQKKQSLRQSLTNLRNRPKMSRSKEMRKNLHTINSVEEEDQNSFNALHDSQQSLEQQIMSQTFEDGGFQQGDRYGNGRKQRQIFLITDPRARLIKRNQGKKSIIGDQSWFVKKDVVEHSSSNANQSNNQQQQQMASLFASDDSLEEYQAHYGMDNKKLANEQKKRSAGIFDYYKQRIVRKKSKPKMDVDDVLQLVKNLNDRIATKYRNDSREKLQSQSKNQRNSQQSQKTLKSKSQAGKGYV